MGSDGSGGVSGRRRPSARGSPKCRTRLALQTLEDRFAPAGLTLLGQWNNGTGAYSDGWAVTQNGRDYAYIGHYGNENGIHVVDITDPANPFLVSNFKSTTNYHGLTWNDYRDVELAQKGNRRTFGYFSSDGGGGIIVANVNNPANPLEVTRIASAQGGADQVHTLSIDGNYLYEVTSRTSTIRIFDITNPANPKWLRNITSATEAVHEVTAINGRLYAAGIFDDPRVEIYDISQIGDLSKPVTLLGTIFSGTRAHTAWPTEDGNFVAVAHEKQGGNLSFWDVTNPGNPQLAWNMALPTNQAYSVHQVMIKGDRLYVSWYQAGIFVYDISNRFNPVLLGSYDTFAGSVNGFNGAWGVYPFLGDNKILGFDLSNGLFIFRLDLGPAPPDSPSVPPTISLAAGEDPVSLNGGVLRVVLGNGGQQVNIARNAGAGTIDVTLGTGELFQFNASDVLRMNIYGGDGDDRFVFDPTISVPVYLDGGAGENSVKDWPALYSTAIHSGTVDHCAQVMGVPAAGSVSEAISIQRFETDGVSALTTAVLVDHGTHGFAGASLGTGGSSVVTSGHAMTLSGLPANTGHGDSMMSGYMGMHGGGKIAPELMVRTSTNSQVGGQVAYHKPG